MTPTGSPVVSITTLTVKPEFTSSNKTSSFDVIEGSDDFEIHLPAKGNPPQIQYFWSKNGLSLKTNSRLSVSGATIVIKKVARDDAGLYSVLASNTEGSTNTSFVLNVLYKRVDLSSFLPFSSFKPFPLPLVLYLLIFFGTSVSSLVAVIVCFHSWNKKKREQEIEVQVEEEDKPNDRRDDQVLSNEVPKDLYTQTLNGYHHQDSIVCQECCTAAVGPIGMIPEGTVYVPHLQSRVQLVDAGICTPL